MDLIGYLLTILIGILINVFGGGGSILTVPLMVYIFSIPATLATTYSLAIVGVTSLFASVPHLIKKQLTFLKMIQFGIPSLVSLYIVRSFLLPIIPQRFEILDVLFIKDSLLLNLFAMLMLIAGFFMIFKKSQELDCIDCNYNSNLLVFTGFIEGIITGMVGAGGGFIVIPILMLYGKLSIKQAIANSLVIIGFKSFIGFIVSFNVNELNFKFLLTLLALAIIGMFIGTRLTKIIEPKKMKPYFGYFVVIMGFFIVIKHVFFT